MLIAGSLIVCVHCRANSRIGVPHGHYDCSAEDHANNPSDCVCVAGFIHPWVVGGYWALPLQYIQNAIAENEFTGGNATS